MNKNIGFILATIGVILLGWFIISNKGDKISQISLPQTPVAVEKKSDTKVTFLGDENALVTVVEYGHFKCPICNRFFRETESQIADKYIKTGKVKFIWKDFPYEGKDSAKASEAAYCAQDQGKFWEYHNSLFRYIWDNYFGRGINAEEEEIFTDIKLKEFSAKLGLDAKEFNSCVDSEKYKQLVQDNYKEGIKKGVKSTPTFFINDQKVVGAQPLTVFSKVIESQYR